MSKAPTLSSLPTANHKKSPSSTTATSPGSNENNNGNDSHRHLAEDKLQVVSDRRSDANCQDSRDEASSQGLKAPTSPAKIEANRRNAKKSEGPKTERGKNASRGNTWKHGLTAMKLFTTYVDGNFAAARLRDFRRRLGEQWQPVGLLEEYWLDRITICFWRSRRALQFEEGQIKKQLWMNRDGDGPFQDSSDMIDKARMVLAAWKKENEGGGLTIETISRLESHSSDDPKLAKFLKDCKKHATTGNEVSTFTPEMKEEFLDLAMNQRQLLNEAEAKIESDKWHDKREVECSSLPDDEGLDLLIRYEKHNDRQMSKAIAELERLQRIRQGEPVPPRAHLEVSIDK